MELPRSSYPKIGKMRVNTEPGDLRIDEFLVHPQSVEQGFTVVHQGRIALESCPVIRELDAHFQASVYQNLRQCRSIVKSTIN